MKKNLVLFGFIITLFCNSIFTEEIKPKIKLIYGRWGNKPGEFGILLEGPEEGIMGRVGPNDFFVGENNKIYIMDNVNKRVQVFDSKGKFIGIDEKLYKESLKKGEERTEVFEDGSRITYYTGLLLKEREERYPNAKKYKIEPIREPQREYPTKFNIIFPDNTKYQIELPKSPIAEACLGEDMNGNVYIFFLLSQKGPQKIFKFNNKHQLVGSIVTGVSRSYYFRLQGSIRLSPRGDIYVMNSDVDGFWIDCYPTELFDRPEGRDFTYIYSGKKMDEKEIKKKEKQLALRLAKTTTGKMRNRAIRWLGWNKVKEAIPIFENYLRQAKEDEATITLKYTCLYALRDINTEEAINLIEKYGLNAKNLKIKIEAAELLINTPFEKKAIEVIKDIIKQKHLPYNIAKKILYFGNYLKNSAKNEETRKEAIDIWIELLRDPRVSREARRYLEKVTGKEFEWIPRGIISKKAFEEYINKWKKWWKENRDTFKFPEDDANHKN